MEESTLIEIFGVLKPLCESFMEEASAEKAEKISILVNRSSNTIIQKIYENILYPIVYHLKNNTLCKDANLKLIETIRIVLLKIRIESSEFFYGIYNCLRTQICQQEKSTELIETHEELKEIVALCLSDLIKHSSISIIESFYVKEKAALISHGIYLCIKIARQEKSINLRLAAINAVMTLLQVHDEVDSHDIVLQDQIANVIMLILPGIISGLLEVSLGSDIQNHKITMMAIRAWSRTLVFIMQDLPQEETNEIPLLQIQKFLEPNESTDHKKNILKSMKRTPAWYAAVSEKLKVLFTELDALTKHSHFKVRQELGVGVSLLLLNCSRNMKPCFQIFLEILITLSEDENNLIAKESREALEKIQEKCIQNKDMKSVIEMVEENLYDILTKMPRIIRTSGESLQLMWLNKLAGYLKVLGKQRLSRILLSPAHLKKLLLTLVYIAELDCCDTSLLEEIAMTDYQETSNCMATRPWKQFKFLFDSKTVEKLYDILRIIGELGDYQTLVNSILEMTLNIPTLKRELTLILNSILEVPIQDKTIQISVCEKIIRHYTEPDYWYLPIKVYDEITLQVAQKNIIQCCLLVEGIGVVAKVLQEDFQIFLLRTLYLIIERAGSENGLLHFVGISTLDIMAKSQNLNGIGTLFQQNVDYITHHVIIRLRRVDRNPGVIDVVEVVANYSTIDYLNYLKDIVDDLLLQSSNHTQLSNNESFLKVFYTFVMSIKRLLKIEHIDENKNNSEQSNINNASNAVINNFLEYYNAKKNSETFENDEMNDEDIENLVNDDHLEDYDVYNPKKEEIPFYVNMIKDIMKRCLHFLPSQVFVESSLAMSVLKEGAIILKEWENVLLPIVHEMWHPLVDRFESSNFLIINYAWQLLCCLAYVSKDFIRSRTLKQILLPLSSFLKKSCKDSINKDSGSTYRYTKIFKLQKEILINLGSFVQNLKLFERETWDILDITEPYLDKSQNPDLQKYCVNMYKEISEYNKDLVWIKCIDIWNRRVKPVIPENDINTWYLNVKHNDVESNHQQNVQQILDHIWNDRYFHQYS